MSLKSSALQADSLPLSLWGSPQKFIFVVQPLSCVWLFATPLTAAHQASLSFTISWSLPKPMFTESVMPYCLVLCRLLLLLPSIFPSIGVFSNGLALHIRWPKYWRFSFNISPSSEYSGFISFMIYWFFLLAVQGTLKSLPQHHSSKTSILQHSAFFMIQLSHPYMTTGKTVTLSVWAFVGRVMSLLYIMLSRFVIAFLPRRKHLLISWLQSPGNIYKYIYLYILSCIFELLAGSGVCQMVRNS